MRLRTVAPTLPLAAALALAGCSTTIDSGKAESLIKKAVTSGAGARVRSVHCPTGKTAKKGASFTCTVLGTDGSTGNALVTETDDSGNVHVSAPFIHPREVEQKMVAGIKAQTSVKALRITCPEIIVGRAGAPFQCRAVGDGSKATVKATQTDGQGRFDYKVQNGSGG